MIRCEDQEPTQWLMVLGVKLDSGARGIGDTGMAGCLASLGVHLHHTCMRQSLRRAAAAAAAVPNTPFPLNPSSQDSQPHLSAKQDVVHALHAQHEGVVLVGHLVLVRAKPAQRIKSVVSGKGV